MKYSYTRTTRLMFFNHAWLMWTALIWLLLFACAVLGIKRVRKITVNLELLFAMIVICVIVIAIFHFESDHEISFMGGSGLGSLLKYDFWIEMILHSAETNVLSNLIWLGSLKPQSLSPKFAALVTSPIKLVVLISAVCFTSLFGQEALHNYKITDQNCLLMEGFDILFVFVPDVLFRTKIKALLNLFWYLSLSYFSFIAPLCTVIATTDSIIHQHQWLRPHRLYLCAALCIFGCLINIWYIQDAGNVIVKMWKKFAVPTLTSALLVMITLAICFVYSINSVINDYRFTYGVPPDNYWVVFWKASPIFSIFSFIFVLYRFKSLKVMMPQAEYIFTVQHCTCFFVLFPIFALLLSRCFKHIKYRTLRLLSIPADDWGPYLEEEKISRIYFFPHRDVKHRNPVVNCKHKCSAMNKTRYREEVLRQNEKLLELKNEFSKHMQGNDKQL